MMSAYSSGITSTENKAASGKSSLMGSLPISSFILERWSALA